MASGAGLEAKPGASAVIGGWIRSGHEVSVVTGRPFSSWETSRLWLDRHGLQRVPLYCLDKYGREKRILNSEFSLKPEDYFRMKFDAAVEDSPSAFRFFDHLPDLKVRVFDRPWNRTAVFPGGNYCRCLNWEDVRASLAENE